MAPCGALLELVAHTSAPSSSPRTSGVPPLGAPAVGAYGVEPGELEELEKGEDRNPSTRFPSFTMLRRITVASRIVECALS